MNGNMEISYIVSTRIPTEKAHGYQICKMCEEFTRICSKVELIVPTRKNNIKKDVFAFYGIENNFKIRKIKSFDFFIFEKYLGKVSFYLQSLFFLIKLFFIKIDNTAIIYTRISGIAWLFKKRGYKVFFEAHTWPNSKNKLYRYFLKDVDGIICNSNGTLEKHKENNFLNLFLAPNGVDLEKFKIDKNKHELRKELDLPVDKNIIMYVGHLYKWKGVDVMIKTAELMKDNFDIIFMLIGGTDNDIEKYKKIIKNKKLNNVTIVGRKANKEIPKYLRSADILLLPNVPISQESIKYTSPIKMFEYMASGIPIIASDLPSIREVLNDDNSIIIRSDSSEKMEKAISNLLKDKKKCYKIAEQSLLDVKKYGWGKRAKLIFEFIQKS